MREEHSDQSYAREYDIERAKEEWLFISGYLEGHGGQRFSTQDVADYTGLAYKTCERYLSQNNGLWQRLKEKGEGKHFLSLAPALKPSVYEQSAPKSSDKIGRQAREEYYKTIEERTLEYKQRRKPGLRLKEKY